MEATVTKPARRDIALAAALSAMGMLWMFLNVNDPKIDASPLVFAPFLAVTVPLAWRRVRPLAVAGIVTVALAAHIAAFGELVRCGVALPVLFLLAFTTASRGERNQALAGFGIVSAGVVLVCATDWLWPGVGPLPMIAIITAGLWFTGRVVRSRGAAARTLEERNAELRRSRDERAAMQVAVDRAKLSGELETLLRARLESLSQAADAGSRTTDPKTAGELLAKIEDDSRRTLAEMRQIVGVLRGDNGSAPVAPAPSITHLEALLVRRKADARITVDGDPRSLPAAVELSAYRIVEQLVSTLADAPDAKVDVEVRFADDALEVRVAGPVAKGADVKAAAARARERASLHRGTLTMRLVRGRIDAVAQLPILVTV